MKNKTLKIVGVIIAVAIVITGVLLWYINIKRPHDIALNEYNSVISAIEAKNAELDEASNNLQVLIDSGEQPLDDNVITTAKEVIKKAGQDKTIIEETPKKTEEIIAKTKELNVPDYSEVIKELNDTYTSLDNSIKQYKQLTNPSEDFVIKRLQTVDEILNVQAVTEENDPNGQLNKPGGYTATVYFESKNINQSEVFGTTIIDKGTDAGGAVEVYATVEDANKRNDYLAAFDGGMLSSGAHTVAGTVVIRTSTKLTASQQKAFEKKILNALSALE